jgi:hypothetical protein
LKTKQFNKRILTAEKIYISTEMYGEEDFNSSLSVLAGKVMIRTKLQKKSGRWTTAKDAPPTEGSDINTFVFLDHTISSVPMKARKLKF